MFTDTQAEWAKTLKPGDEVAVVTNSYGNCHSVEYNTVARLTPTGRIVVVLKNGNQMTFRPDGHEIGHEMGWYTRLEPRSQDLSDWMEKIHALRVINRVNWKDLPPEKLRQVRQIIESP